VSLGAALGVGDDGAWVEPGLEAGLEGSVVGSSLGPADGAGVTSGLPWATDGSGEDGTGGTVPRAPLPPPHAARREVTASRAVRRSGLRRAFM
jgi:hypothetical protein